jgi:hypothetical protein
MGLKAAPDRRAANTEKATNIEKEEMRARPESPVLLQSELNRLW